MFHQESRNHRVLSLLVVMGILIFAPLNLLQTSAANSAPDVPLSDSQLSTIVKSIKERNRTAEFFPNYANSLGLPKIRKNVTFQYRAVKDDAGVYHVFVLLGGAAGYLIVRRTPEGETSLRVDPNLNLIFAIFQKPGYDNPSYSVVPLSEATKALHGELLVWADVANQLDQDKSK